MRWESLFADLEAQFEREEHTEAAAARIEEQRLRAARSSLAERLRAAASAGPGLDMRMRMRDGSRFVARPLAVGADWLSAELATGEQLIVPLASVASVTFGPAQLMPSRAPRPDAERPSITERLRIQVVLRDLARRRVPLELECEGEAPGERSSLSGTLELVGLDHLDIAVHPLDRPRRNAEVIEVRTIALSALIRVVVR